MKKAGTLLDYVKVVPKSTKVYIAMDGVGAQIEPLDDIVYTAGGAIYLYPAVGKYEVPITDAEHPIRQYAIRIIEQVLERETGRAIEDEEYYRLEDELVDILARQIVKSKG